MIRQLALATLYLCCLTKCGHSFLSKWAKSPVPILSLRARMPVLHFDRSKLYDQESMYYKPSIYKVEEDPLVPVIETIVRVADQRKARQMAAFRISHLTSICTFMMIIEGMWMIMGFFAWCDVFFSIGQVTERSNCRWNRG